MAEFDVSQTTTTNLNQNVDNYSVGSKTPDKAEPENKYTTYDYPDSDKYTGYYKTIPEFKGAIDALALWAVGRGFDAPATRTKIILENITGWGEDTAEAIFSNLIVQKKVLGDAFAEIIRSNETGQIINIKPLYTGDMRVYVNKQGIIEKYEQKSTGKTFSPSKILHLVNQRYANEIHGISVIESLKWVIDARNEAMSDYRKVLHRNVVPVRIIEIDTDNTTKRNALITEYHEAINKGEVLVIPKGTVEIKDNSITIQDPTTWITYLENFFYQVVGVPKAVIGGNEQLVEASSKVTYLSFEQVYSKEQRELEADLWNQAAIKVRFRRPTSIKDDVQSSEAKNTGQTSFQNNESKVGVSRTE